MKVPTTTVDSTPWYPPVTARVSLTSSYTQTGPAPRHHNFSTSNSTFQRLNPTLSASSQTPAANDLALEWEMNTSDHPPGLNEEWELNDALFELVERARRQEIRVRFYSLHRDGMELNLFEMWNLRLTAESFIRHVSYIDMWWKNDSSDDLTCYLHTLWILWNTSMWPDPMLAVKRSLEKYDATKTLRRCEGPMRRSSEKKTGRLPIESHYTFVRYYSLTSYSFMLCSDNHHSMMKCTVVELPG